jgi:hypothetical protein
MLFLKTTATMKAPGIYEVDVAAKPPGKTFGVYLATDPDNPPQAVLAELAELGFKGSYQKSYTHRDGGRVLDLHFEKDGTDLFKGWKPDECNANLAALNSLFGKLGIQIATRVMSMAEAYA